MKYIAFACLLATVLGACVPDSTPQLHQLIEEEWAYRTDTFDVWKDQIWEASDDEIIVAKTLALEERKAAYWRTCLEQLNTINAEHLTADDKVNLEMLKFIVKNDIEAIELGNHLIPIQSDGGFHVGLVYFANSHIFEDKEDYEDYIEHLNKFKKIVTANIGVMREGMAKGRTLPKVVLQDYESTVDPHIVEKVEDSYFFHPFTIFPSSITEAEQNELLQAGKQAIKESVIAGYRQFSDFLKEEYRPNANEKIGIGDTPGGKELYEQRVRYFTTLDMTAEEVFKIGEQEVARIRAEMETIIADVGFEGSFADFLKFLRTDEQFYCKTPECLLKEASYLAKKIDGQLPKVFNKLPRLPYGVAPVPDAIAPKYTTGRYVPGSYDDHRSGTYWVNTYNLPARPLYVLPALTLHEAVPGHHLQISMSAELENLPEFRNLTYLSAYGEGWALYCEWLGKELGIYQTPYQDFGRLTYEMWRACRLVVDVGMHYKGWTREEAIDFMASNTALSMHEVNTEIDRYIGWPGQALSYKIGELKIKELRKHAEEELKEAFDLRGFHDLILSKGSVPLFVLEDMVEAWILESY